MCVLFIFNTNLFLAYLISFCGMGEKYMYLFIKKCTVALKEPVDTTINVVELLSISLCM